MDERDYGTREVTSTNRSGGRGPVGTMLGWTFGPFGAAVGSVVDANRFAIKLSVGAGADRDRGNDLDRGTTIEIGDSGEADVESDGTEIEPDGTETESDGVTGDNDRSS